PISVAVTVAPGIALPLESVTLPSSVPVTVCAAAADGMTRMRPAMATNARKRCRYRLPDALHKLRIKCPPLKVNPDVCSGHAARAPPPRVDLLATAVPERAPD